MASKSYVAFLRGMNLGRRRVKNEQLCACFEKLGLSDVWAFLASGNIAFRSTKTPTMLVALIEAGLGESLGYAVPTVVRTASELALIAAHQPFGAQQRAQGNGKLQVGLREGVVDAKLKRRVLALQSASDQLAVHGSEIYWLPHEGVSASEVDLAAIDGVGKITVRTQRTLQRLAARLA
ncbi:MAG: DUF1697 domain-containing protein [Deltaproteobacteria bacterium]|nr:DUF1697 domain-containing protein [Deltaproteobacteria bacterium]